MKFNQTTLDKLEKVLQEAGYIIRYERGTFQSGWCLLEQKKVVVLNKYLTTEGRINTVMDLIPQVTIDPAVLTPESAKLHTQVMQRVEIPEEGTDS